MINRRQMIKISALGIASTAVPAAHAMSDMTMRYNTGNPVEPSGSSDPRDLFDNSANFDLHVNGEQLDWIDRLGRARKSLAGMESEFESSQSYRKEKFEQFLLSSGYQDIGDYMEGLVIASRNQVFLRSGEFYRTAASTALPYTLTGDWSSESIKFVSVGDAALRQELAGEDGSDHVVFTQDSAGSVPRKIRAKMQDSVNVADFGAIGDGKIRMLSERFGSDLAAAQAEYPFVTSLTQSVDWAGICAAQLTGKPVEFGRGVFMISDELMPFESGSWFYGAGVDIWEHLDPSVLKENDSGTHLIFYGSGAKTRTCYGATDMRTAGGVLENPDSVSALDTKYSLTSFHNNDAADGIPSTLRKFSCGIYVKPNAQNAGIRGIRIHPSFDGISGYNDILSTGLGDSWDVGLFVDNAPLFTIDNVQVVGYWRIKGVLVSSITRPGTQGKNFLTSIKGSTIQAGLAIRGGDQSKVVAVTSTTIDIPWADNHPYFNTGSVSTPKGSFTYSSTNKVTGTSNGTVLRFNGVSPDPVSAALGNGPVRIGSGSGLGGLSISDSLITGLDHSSMCLATNPLIGLGVSSALEVSGTFRHVWISKTYIQTREDVIAHLHSIDDLRLSQTQFEANDFRLVPGGTFSTVHGGRVICSPQDISNPLDTATGDTSISMYQHHSAPYVDMFPYVPRVAGSKFSASFEFFKPRRLQYLDLQIPDSDHLDIHALETQDIRIRMATGRSTVFQDGTNTTRVTISSSGSMSLAAGAQITYGNAAAFLNIAAGQVYSIRHGGTIRWQLTAAGSWIPGADAGQNLAAADARINNSFFAVAPTVSSDARLKKVRGILSDAELAAWGKVQAKVFQMLDMVEEKGEEEARLHCAYIAQEVQQAFIDQNLDPSRYALWCEDPVYTTSTVLTKVTRQKVVRSTEMRETIEMRDGVPVRVLVREEVEVAVTQQVPVLEENGQPALDREGRQVYATLPVMEEVDEVVEVREQDGTRLGLRYEQCLVFETAYLRSIQSAQSEMICGLKARLDALEGAQPY